MKKINKKIIIMLMVFLSFVLILTNCTKEEPNLTDVNNLIKEITNLPDDIRLSDEETVNHLEQLYQALEEDAQAKVTNYQKLVEARTTINTTKQQVADVISAINDLPYLSALTLEHLADIEAVRLAYNKLDKDAQNYVTNYAVLVQCEAKINALYLSQKRVEEMINIINDLPSVEDFVLTDENALTLADNKYEELTQDEKTLVTNYGKIEQLQEKLRLLKLALTVDEAILALPAVDMLTYDDEEIIKNVRNLYEELEDQAKVFVKELDLLIFIEQKMAEFLALPYEVKFYLDGGNLENTSQIEDHDTLEVKINYYNIGFFDYYADEVFLYQTSSLGTHTLYTYALKIGLNRQGAHYVVNQIIDTNTDLVPESRISEYYLLIHVENSAQYNKFKKVSLGDIVEMDSDDLSYEVSYNKNLNVKITLSTISYINIATYQGEVKLPTPTRSGYRFIGFYDNAQCIGNIITKISRPMTLYACWILDEDYLEPDDILNLVSDVVTTETVDHLIFANQDASFTWHSSNPNLYVINQDGSAYASKIYQTRHNQTVTISVDISYNDGNKDTKSKEITIAPIEFVEMSRTPIATYFSVSALSNYYNYSPRYQTEHTLFSNRAKKVLNVIYYAFVEIDNSGNCYLASTNALEEVLALKENDIRVVACVSGTSTSASLAFNSLCSNDETRATFVNNLMDLVEEYNFDGLDIDWESSSGAYVVASKMSALMRDLRMEMNRRVDANATPYFLSAAVPASSWGAGTDRFNFAELHEYVDAINLMSYDMNRTDVCSHLSPLYSSKNDNGYGFGCYYGYDLLVRRGLSKSQIYIGCAGYGKAYQVNGTIYDTQYPALGLSGKLIQIPNLKGSFASGTLFGNAITELINSGKYQSYTEYNDGYVVGSYLYNEDDHIFVTYDSKEAIIAKYRFALQNGTGMMCWCYPEDTADNYIDALYEAMFL